MRLYGGYLFFHIVLLASIRELAAQNRRKRINRNMAGMEFLSLQT